MNEEELHKWYASARQGMDSLEKIRFIQEIFFQMQDDSIKLPMGDYNEVHLYLNQLADKIYSVNNKIIVEQQS